MVSKIHLLIAVVTLVSAEKDWVWSDNSRSESRNVLQDPGSFRDKASARYEIYENEENYERPTFAGAPIRPVPRPPPPPGSGLGFIPNERPLGIYGQNNINAGYGPGQGNYFTNEGPTPNILTGPVPSWVKEGPIKNFDRCKCAEKFNCNSPGISYGHCDVGKQYCCYSINKKNQIGGPIPSRPIHSIENGILSGPGGPVDPIPGIGHPNRRPGGSFGIGGARPFAGQNSYSPANGILVGPGGPYDRPF